MESVIAEGKGLMRKACSGERRGGKDDRSGDGDTRRGGAGGVGVGVEEGISMEMGVAEVLARGRPAERKKREASMAGRRPRRTGIERM